jgi:hypothetical protein
VSPISGRKYKGNIELIEKSIGKEPYERQRRKWAENKMKTDD